MLHGDLLVESFSDQSALEAQLPDHEKDVVEKLETDISSQM